MSTPSPREHGPRGCAGPSTSGRSLRFLMRDDPLPSPALRTPAFWAAVPNELVIAVLSLLDVRELCQARVLMFGGDRAVTLNFGSLLLPPPPGAATGRTHARSTSIFGCSAAAIAAGRVGRPLLAFMLRQRGPYSLPPLCAPFGGL